MCSSPKRSQLHLRSPSQQNGEHHTHYHHDDHNDDKTTTTATTNHEDRNDRKKDPASGRHTTRLPRQTCPRGTIYCQRRHKCVHPTIVPPCSSPPVVAYSTFPPFRRLFDLYARFRQRPRRQKRRQWKDGETGCHSNVVRGNRIETNGNECVDIKEGSSGNVVDSNLCSAQLDAHSGCFNARGDGNTFWYGVLWLFNVAVVLGVGLWS